MSLINKINTNPIIPLFLKENKKKITWYLCICKIEIKKFKCNNAITFERKQKESQYDFLDRITIETNEK